MIIKNYLLLLKYTLLIAINTLCIANATGQQKYLAIYYFKYSGIRFPDNGRYVTPIPSLEGADFFRVLLPPSGDDKRFNVQEYYSNGKIKLICKILPEDTVFMKDAYVRPDGNCATYYPDGKRETLINYVHEKAQGDEYLFFPSGKVYQYMINDYPDVKSIDCYDINGNQVCNNGNGKWIEYDGAYNDIVAQGQVVNGKYEGEWRQHTKWPDSINYVFVYKKNIITERFGLDKNGVKYPFTYPFVNAFTKGGAPTFIQSVKYHLKLSSADQDEKALIDTMHISFIVEKDGTMSHYDVLGIVPYEIKEALINAMTKCRNWTSTKLYGIPFRTQIVLPMTYEHGYKEYKFEDSAPVFYGGIISHPSGIDYADGLDYWKKFLPDN